MSNTADSGPGSLREAVLLSNALLGIDTIQIDPALNGATINLATSLPAPTEKLTIDGPTAGTLTIRFLSQNDIFSGAMAITKQNAGTLILAGNNRSTGDITINAGGLQGNTWSIRGDITNHGALIFDQDIGDGTYTGNITGTGSFTKTGIWKLTLTGTNTYTGGTVISAGLLEGDTDSLQGNILNDSSLIFDQAFKGTYAGNISGIGNFAKIGGGTLILSGTNTYAGLTIVSGGVLQGNTGSLPSDIVNGSAVVFDQAVDGVYAGKINFRGSLTKQGAGALTLTGVNSYTGGTIISEGALRGNTASLQGNIINNAAVVFDQPYDASYSGAMSGIGTLTKLGAGTLTLSGNNTYTGATNVAAGRLAVNGQLAGPLNVQSGGTLVANGPNALVTNSLTIAGTPTAPTATLDVTTSAVVLDYPAAGPNPAVDVRSRIIAGRGGTDLIGAWNGQGIISGAAAVKPTSLSVGYAVNADLPLGPYTNFRGRPVDPTSVLVVGTRIGDATLDGVVGDDDITVIGAKFGMTSGATWALGDFDYDSDVDDDDVTLISALYNPSAPPIAAPPAAAAGGLTAVPEPSTWLLLTLGAFAAVLFDRRRRRHVS